MPISNITANELKNWIDNDEVCLVDVREAIEHKSFHISNSHHLALGEISTDKLPKTDKKLVIYCLKGVRGKKACEKLISEQSDLEVFNLTGGIHEWKSSRLPVNETQTSHLSLERQVQLTIGSAVLVSAIATVLIDSAFVWIAALFGAGLIFAGLTGSCALATLMAKMPWNKM